VTRAARVLVAAVAVVALAAAGCSSGGTDRSDRAPAARDITQSEASVLADLLVRNHDAGGAHLVATVPFGVATFRLTGDVDWANHVGRVTVHTDVRGRAATPDRDVVWNPDVVFEEVPGLEQRLAARGRPGVEWVARQLDPRASNLHLVLQLIDTTSSTQRDNPVLLMSNGVRWLRRDHVGATSVDVYRNQRTTYWVGRKDHRLHRLEAALGATRSTATVTFSDLGPRTIATPDDPSIVALADVADLYQQLLGSQH
jgi:hypothetical protein